MTAAARYDVAIVGSGFAGTILARLLRRRGRAVVVLERGRHPRFALGESTTPLANLALERLARRYDLPDLHALAAHGRWLRELPHLRRGLKRGFTFYRHASGAPYTNGPENEARLLVAASPDDAVADSHWLRSDVDHHLARAAAAEGVELWEEADLASIDLGADGARLAGRRGGRPFALQARFVVDASGPSGFLARHLPIPAVPIATDARLVFGHFAGVPPFAEVAAAGGAELSPGPYPDDWAAVHHVFPGGWMYLLRFDHEVTSAGFMVRNDGAAAADLAAWHPTDATATFRALLARYPPIAAQFREAEPVFPLGQSPRIQHRLARAAGPGWALLPHTFAFFDPLFSTGIAWSLLGAERLAGLLEESASPSAAALDRYARQLAAEADRLDRLVHAAYLAMPDFDLFRWVTMLYFVAVSFAEVRQRLLPEEETGRPAAWEGFLGTGDPVLDPVFAEATERVQALAASGAPAADGPIAAAARADFAAWLCRALVPRNVAGLADPARKHLYPVDLELLRQRAPLLGLSAAELAARFHRLRSPS
jgi:FADH2 O2-dependent halogenase